MTSFGKRALGVCLGLGWLALAGCEDANWRGTDISETMPPLDFELVSESGTRINEGDVAGDTVLVYFGFTHCPDVCPTALARLSAALRELDETVREDVTVLFVSVDPERDTPEVLKAYTEAFGPRFVGVTGDKAALDEVTNRYRVSYRLGEPEADGSYDVDHSSAIFAFDAGGDARLLMRDSDSVEAIAADIRRLAQQG
ncbi:SCO family protein [Halomonas denitrificans]|uniref:SCO family protein n=2 Tax=Halomonas TaxID=2745 RepID=UPI001CD77239|nr:SCO family protein [Halomonas denitrificans]MCA0976322.1 SCO family protein [Halomonas denitrificans]